MFRILLPCIFVLVISISTPLIHQSHAAAGNAAQFTSASNSYISAASSNELKTFSAITVEAWIRPSGGKEWALILGKQYNPSDDNPWYSFRLCKSHYGTFPDNVNFNIAPVTAGGEVGVMSTTVVQNDVWTHVAGVYDGATIKIYINGELENTVSQDGALRESALPMYIGKAPWTNYNNFNGEMDELRIWNVARTQEQIQATMNYSLGTDRTGLVAYWTFNDAPGSSTAADESIYSHVGTLYNGAAIIAGSTAPIGSPDYFSFNDQADVSLNATIVSNPITVTGVSGPTAISVSGGDYSVSADNGATWGTWTEEVGTVNEDYRVMVRQTSSATNSATTTATLTIGGVSADFTVTTAASGSPNGSGLKAWWKGEDNPYDSIGGYHGSWIGSDTYAAGKSGRAFQLNGTDQAIAVPDGIVPNSARYFTVSAWVNADSVTGAHYVFYGGANEGEYVLSVSDGILYLHLNLASSGWQSVSSAATIAAGSWHQVTGVRRGTSIEIWVDGELKGSQAIPDEDLLIATWSPGQFPSRIGAYHHDSGVDMYRWDGLIDDVRVFDRALSSTDIARLAGRAPDPFSFIDQTDVPLGTIIVSNPATITGISEPVTVAITGGEYSISTDGGTTWGGWTSADGTVNVNDRVMVRQTSSATDSMTTTATLSIGGVEGTFSVTTAAAGDPKASGLAAWWRGEDNAYDSVGGNHGTMVNGATFAAGHTGRSFSFDGTSAYVNVPNSSLWNFGSDDFTIDLWIKFNETKDNFLIAHDEGSGNQNKWAFYVGNGYLNFHLNSPGTGPISIGYGSIDFSYTIGQWYNLAITRNGDTYTFYVDGASVGTVTDSHVIPDANAPLTIGQGEGTHFVHGSIDEVKIFNRALSALEVSTLAGTRPDAFSFTPVTGAARSTLVESESITISGITQPAAISITGGAYELNGSGTWLTTSSTINPGASVKVRLTSSTGYAATTTSTLTIGGVSGNFDVTTIPAPATFIDDFTAGIAPANWTVNAGAYTIDDSNGDIRMSKPSGPGEWGRIYFKHLVYGDFDISVDYRDAVLAGNHNQIQLNLYFGGQYAANRRENWDGERYSVWLDPPQGTYGALGTADTSGTLRVTRVGSTVTFYANGVQIHQGNFNDSPVTDLWLSLQNNGSEDAISVTFDNFVIKASNILTIDESGLLSWWKGEGDALDSFGFNNGALAGGAGYAAGKVGEAFNLDGSSGSVDLGNWFNLQSFTISMWVNPGATQQTYADIIDNNHTGSRGWVIQQDYTTTNRYLFGAVGSPALYFTLPADQWTHVVVTRDGATRVGTVYLDGVPLTSVTGSSDITYDGSQNLHLGRHDNLGRYWNGRLDEVKVFNRALTPAEIATLAGIAPDPFSFDPVIDAPLNSWVESAPATVTGTINVSPVSISGGEYAIYPNGGSSWGEWTGLPGTVNTGDQVTVRVTSASGYSATVTATLTIGGVEGDFSVTTAPDLVLNPVASPTNLVSQSIGGTVKSGAAVTVSVNGSAHAAVVSGTTWSYYVTDLARGDNGIIVSATDSGYAPDAKSATINCVAPQLTLSVTGTVGLSGTAGGTVTSDPAGIACTTGPCAALFDGGLPVTLLATPDGNSMFGNWGGDMAGTEATKDVSMGSDSSGGDRSVTATFIYVEPAKIEATGLFYPHIRDAYNAMTGNGTILARQFLFAGDLTMGNGYEVVLKGGYNPAYSDNSDYSTISGTLTVGVGTLTVERLAIR